MYVVGLAFLGGESGEAEGEGAAAAELTGEGKGTEHGAEEVLLLTVEIDAEALDILHGAEVGLAVLGLEAVVVARDIADDIERPLIGGPPREVGLIVDEVGVVLAAGLQRTHEITVGLVAEALREGDLSYTKAVIDIGAEEAGTDRALVALGALVGDVEDRGHAVAILGLEATGGELHTVHHVGVDDREAFLLATADEHGTIDLHAVDIDAVLIKGAAADVVLRGELVMGGNAGLRSHEFLHGIAAGAGHALQILGGQLLRGAHLAAHLADDDLTHVGAAVAQGDIPRELALRPHQHLGLLLEADERVVDDHRVCGLEIKRVLAVDGGHSACHLTLHLNGHEGQRLLVLIDDTTAEVAGCRDLHGGVGHTRGILRSGRRSAQEEQKDCMQEVSSHYYHNAKEALILCYSSTLWMPCSRWLRMTRMPYFAWRCSARCWALYTERC